MEKAIYKITNIINGKIYIGESKNPEYRFKQHQYGHSKDNSLIDKAIDKYGIKNFTMEILGWFEDWADKEKYYIKFYNSLTPYGYNIHQGGGEPPTFQGENHPQAKITLKTAQKIQKQLLDWKIPRKQIIKTNKITTDIIRHINDGTSWHDKNLQYPLRPEEKILNEMKANEIIKLLQNTNLSQKEIASIVGWGRSAVTMINLGVNHHRENLEYPIRK